MSRPVSATPHRRGFALAPSASGARLRTAVLGLLVVAALGVAPVAASASSMSISIGSTTVNDDAQHPYTASGTADEDAFAFVKIYLDEGSGCPESSKSGVPGTSVTPDLAAQVTGSFQYSGTYFVNSSGSYLLCGYTMASDGRTLATAITAFKAVSDTDGDGVRDDQDACPNERGVDERVQGPSPTYTADGCPIRDGDRDGVRNEDDRCPTEPGFDSRTNQRTADGCPVRDSDGDGVVDSADGCPNQFGRDLETRQPTPDGCTPPDGDGDLIADARDQCPLENAASQAAKRDPARPGCLESGFRVVFGDSYATFTGREKAQGTLARFIVQTTGFLRAKSFEVTVTLSAASARKARIKKRQIAASSGTLPATGESTFRDVYKRPTVSAANKKKLRKLKSISFKYAYTVTLVNGQTRTKTDSFTLRKGKTTGVFHTVFGSGTNAAGEEG